jgi:hypothetical protein
VNEIQMLRAALVGMMDAPTGQSMASTKARSDARGRAYDAIVHTMSADDKARVLAVAKRLADEACDPAPASIKDAILDYGLVVLIEGDRP